MLSSSDRSIVAFGSKYWPVAAGAAAAAAVSVVSANDAGRASSSGAAPGESGVPPLRRSFSSSAFSSLMMLRSSKEAVGEKGSAPWVSSCATSAWMWVGLSWAVLLRKRALALLTFPPATSTTCRISRSRSLLL
uniref:Putative secreted peptide n=1 Tax=Anopheles braziliensis TaxID=58242 RepID=A0A2M3ZXC9_9DIPT